MPARARAVKCRAMWNYWCAGCGNYGARLGGRNRLGCGGTRGTVYAKQRLSRVRWVLAVQEDSAIHEPRDLQGKVIATEIVRITANYLKRHGV